MSKLNGFLAFCALILFSACNPKVSTSIVKAYPVTDFKQEVVLIGLNESVPENSQVLGQVKIGDTGFTTNCNYEFVIEKAKNEARKIGGNAIKILEHKPPTVMGSVCHRITADVLKIDNIESYISNEEVLLDVDYAILNVYRYSGPGSLVGYDLYLGDSVLCRVVNNFKTTIHIKKDGLNTLWARTESKNEVPINIVMGKTYYLRCGLRMGVVVGNCKLELVDSKTGKAEFESFNAKNQ